MTYMQILLLAATNGCYTSEVQCVVDFYGDDFNKSELETQLEVFSQMEIDLSRCS